MSDVVTPETYRAALKALAVPRRYAVAVSGGRDSMALMRLAAEDAKAGAEVLALTVDHGLREGARSEADQAARWCEAAGLSHRLLVWEGDKPQSGKQDAARRARYRLLASEAETQGAGAILAAHTADDQAETVFMRLARGAGPAGLSGMAPVSRIAAGAGGPVLLVRPLLGATRAATRATCGAFGQAFVDDPSNDDPAYERVRARALLAALEEQNLLTRDALLKTAARARCAAERLAAAQARAFADAGGCFHAGGWASLAARRVDASSAGMIARLIGAVSGGDYPPGEEEARAALLSVDEGGAATLGGALMKRRGETLFILREPAALLGRAGIDPLKAQPLAPGARVLWDGRFIAENRGRTLASLSPLGPGGLAALGFSRGLFDAPDEALVSAPGAFFAAEGPIALKPLAEERFFAPILRFS